MTISLEKSLVNRERMIEAAKIEIIGPSQSNEYSKILNENVNMLTQTESYENYFHIVGGIKEEVLQREFPARRYAAGMLYPIDATVGEVLINDILLTEEKEDTSSSSHKIEAEKYQDAEPIEDIAVLNDERLPSSMGLTSNISKNTQTIKITISGGQYRPKFVNIEGKGQKKWWLRQSLTGELELPIKELSRVRNSKHLISLKNNLDESVAEISLECLIQCREIKNSYLTTITLTNRSLSKNQKASLADELIFFQAKLTVETDEKGEFLNYPKHYERNLPMTEDEANDELLYRNKINYAFGHACSTSWNESEKVRKISTTFLPTYETSSMTPDVEVNRNGTIEKVSIKMIDIINCNNQSELTQLMKPLLDAYNEWISKQENEVPFLAGNLKVAAKRNMKLCRDSLKRMEYGLQHLEEPLAFKAFILANKSILLQQVNGKTTRTPSINKLKISFDIPYENVVVSMDKLNNLNNSWRAFQIAFFLMSIESLKNEESIDREIVDLIWFPTGGGKTEAYFGVAAFQMLYRRLKNKEDAGVDILMRYTLRLLTADQFQRSSRLICALEVVRQQNEDILGTIPYSIGMWVGGGTSPNTFKQAIDTYNSLKRGSADAFVVNKCPWCGCKLGKTGKGNESAVLGYKAEKKQFITHCLDRKCTFFKEIPVYFVDEAIYMKRPTFLIGTVDKFVQLTWKPEASSLFGIDANGNQVVNPPSLIIQDELHLISGPLGTLAGLYEVLIEELCTKKVRGKRIKPKIISATATIKEFENQARSLFGRSKANLFPSPGLDIDDSFFAKVATDSKGKSLPGRKYVGVYTSSVGVLQAQVKVYSGLLQEGYHLPAKERDPYWTLLAFYNSLRELGNGLNICSMDVLTYMKGIRNREGYLKNRFIKNPLELTSRMQNNEVIDTIDKLKVELDTKNEKKVLDVCLASNIIEVGVDIDRLSMMAVVGQPKTTAQYIQVTGRVGRRWQERPGVIFTIYSNRNSRDKSHFEHFIEYHQRLYAQVESTSITPFSDASLERGLNATLIAFLRQGFSKKMALEPDAEEYQRIRKTAMFGSFIKTLAKRVQLVDMEQYDSFKKYLGEFDSLLKSGLYHAWEAGDDTPQGMMYRSGDPIANKIYPDAIATLNSLRSVDASSLGRITSLMIHNQPKSIDSLEDLLEL